MVCRYIYRTRCFQDAGTNNTYGILHRLSCTVSGVIYIIACRQCTKLYVGQTARPLKVRIAQHLCDLRAGRDTPTARHFKTCGLGSFSFFGIEHAPNTSRRLQREATWIERLHSTEPEGMNTLERSSPAPSVLVLPHSRCASKIARMTSSAFPSLPVTCAKRRSSNLRNTFK